MSLGQAIFLFTAALIAGAINSVAGGGSFISFPALLFTGIPPISANATSTTAVWPGSVASALAYREKLSGGVGRILPPLMIAALLGGFVGAHILLRTPQTTFLHVVPWLILSATSLFLLSGSITRWLKSSHESGIRFFRGIGGPLVQFIIAIYIGYFGAGVGIVILALLALMGIEDIHTMNGMKALLAMMANGAAIATFIFAKAIVWPEAMLMIAGAIVGGYGGAYLAQKIHPKYARMFVIFIGITISAYFFIRY